MTIAVDIRPEVQAELARQAAVHGSATEAYAAGARIRQLRKGVTLGGAKPRGASGTKS